MNDTLHTPTRLAFCDINIKDNFVLYKKILFFLRNTKEITILILQGFLIFETCFGFIVFPSKFSQNHHQEYTLK